jgi:hypothetical protein
MSVQTQLRLHSECANNSSTFVAGSVVKQWLSELALHDGNDFGVVLGVAERLRPGTHGALATDPAAVEEQLLLLFDTF